MAHMPKNVCAILLMMRMLDPTSIMNPQFVETPLQNPRLSPLKGTRSCCTASLNGDEGDSDG